jgi:hypothetical protein
VLAGSADSSGRQASDGLLFALAKEGSSISVTVRSVKARPMRCRSSRKEASHDNAGPVVGSRIGTQIASEAGRSGSRGWASPWPCRVVEESNGHVVEGAELAV